MADIGRDVTPETANGGGGRIANHRDNLRSIPPRVRGAGTFQLALQRRHVGVRQLREFHLLGGEQVAGDRQLLLVRGCRSTE